MVSGRNQEFKTSLTGGPRAEGASVKIMSEELKPDHGKNIAVFSMNLELDGNDNKFVLINRSKGEGRYAIIYKSEIKPKE